MIAVGRREGYRRRLHRRNAESLKHSKSFMMSRPLGNRTQVHDFPLFLPDLFVVEAWDRCTYRLAIPNFWLIQTLETQYDMVHVRDL